ncbi:MAG: hypothetical protein MSA82_01575 [Oscillospiraceae bacterium]|nr:hypothetical protein [Oscillospiraceae bacterium]
MIIKELKGANMDIDLVSENVGWNQTICPWNEEENTKEHRCAVKDTSICKYFCGIKYLDSVLCSYPYENSYVLSEDETDRMK